MTNESGSLDSLGSQIRKGPVLPVRTKCRSLDYAPSGRFARDDKEQRGRVARDDNSSGKLRAGSPLRRRSGGSGRDDKREWVPRLARLANQEGTGFAGADQMQVPRLRSLRSLRSG